MAENLSAIQFLASSKPVEVPPVCVLFGDEPLLKRESLEKLRQAVLTGEDGELSFTTFDGQQVELREVFDELATVSMFGGGRRMALVEQADKFVTKHRDKLEEYCEKPRSSSVLVLDVESWPATTRLYKKVAAMGRAIQCNLPKAKWGSDVDEGPVADWLQDRAVKRHQAQLAKGAGELLLEIVGPQLGRLDQELAKLAVLAEEKPAAGKPATGDKNIEAKGRVITRELVEMAVGGWRAKTGWAMIEAALDGNAAEAMVQLDRLLLAGEEPIALLAMMGGSLRRMAAASRIIETAESQRRRITLPQALEEAGVTPKRFVLEKAERQLRQINRRRAKTIYSGLLEADLALKGSSSRGLQARMVLEQWIVRLSRQLAQAPASK